MNGATKGSVTIHDKFALHHEGDLMLMELHGTILFAAAIQAASR